MSETAYILEWLLIIEIIGLIGFPLIASFCNIPDRGYSISKLIGLLMVTYATWLTVSLGVLDFGLLVIVISISVLILSILVLAYSGKLSIPLLSIKAVVMKSELVFLISFLVFTLIVMNKPDIYGPHSEDFMDFGFLQSILRSANFPPRDPWLAGETLSYYYFGHLIAAILTKLSGIPSNITYNLAASMFFALTVQAAYGAGYNLTQRSFYGILGALFVSLSGIMSGFLQLLAYLAPGTREFIRYAPLQSQDLLHWFLEFDFWNSISIIPQTFNFYPYHTFAHGYLHAHMMSIPFQVMLVTLGISLFRGTSLKFWHIVFLGLSVGFFAGMNVWDYPVYLFFIFLVFYIIERRKAFDLGVKIALISIMAYLPYFLSRDAGGFGGLQLVSGRTSILNFLEIFGLFVFLIFSFLFMFFLEHRKNIRLSDFLIGTLLFLLMLIAGVIYDFQILPLMGIFILVSVYGIVIFHEHNEKFVLLLVLLGSLIALFPEVFYIVDGMPWVRFNTIMKLHLQVWVIWGIASAYAMYYIGKKIRYASPAGVIWSTVVIFLILASLIHPVASTISWTSGKTFFGTSTNGTLDGTAYLSKLNLGDYMAINWINKNIMGTPVILEAPGSAYTYSSRISTLTGLPTVIGWVSHEYLWNNNWSKIDDRVKDVDIIYSTTDTTRAISLLKKYKVSYVYSGDIEIEKYPAQSLQKFEDKEYYELVYIDKAQIFRVK